jgi:hypothetical protein
LLTSVTLLGFLAALAIRVVPGLLGGAVDYDEGVYLSGAWALTQGRLPWRDFVFLHPPGVLLWLAPLTLAGPKLALLLARLLTALLGALNVVLVGRVVRGWAGVCAALFFATWWETVITDRGVFLEPLMNAAGLGALALVSSTRPLTSRRAVLAGVLCAASMAVKLWGGVWCLLVFLVAERSARRPLVLAAVTTFAVVVAPFVAFAPADAVRELFTVHSLRPPDGDLERAVRLREMFVSRSLDVTVLLGLSLPLLFFGGERRRLGLAALTASGIVVAAFLSASAWWNQYDAALAPFLVLTLGAGLHGAFARLHARPRVVLVLALVVLGLGSLHLPLAWRRPEKPEAVPVLPEGTCSFSSADAIVAGRWPPLIAPMLVDSYGQGLVDASSAGRFPTVNEAFVSEAAQRTFRLQLPQCRHLLLGWRGDWHLNAETKAWLDRHFEATAPGLFSARP